MTVGLEKRVHSPYRAVHDLSSNDPTERGAKEQRSILHRIRARLLIWVLEGTPDLVKFQRFCGLELGKPPAFVPYWMMRAGAALGNHVKPFTPLSAIWLIVC